MVTNGLGDALRNVLRSSNFSEEGARELIRSGHLREFLPGVRLIDPRSSVPFLAFVESGTVHLFIRQRRRSSPVAIAVLGRGDIVGWELLADSQSGTFEARTSSHCRFLCVSPSALILLCSRSPRAAIQITEAALRTMKSVQQAGKKIETQGSDLLGHNGRNGDGG